jgi:hypothetical protein
LQQISNVVWRSPTAVIWASLLQRLLTYALFVSILPTVNAGANMAKYLQCSECGKLAFYYDDYVGTEKPFYKRFMRYPEGETKHEPPRCFSCGAVPRLIHEFIKEEKPAAAKH